MKILGVVALGSRMETGKKNSFFAYNNSTNFPSTFHGFILLGANTFQFIPI